MKIKSINIKNLRAYDDETIFFDNYTCLVGANGAGKSTILCALNIFFRELENFSTNFSNLDKEDFHCGNIEDPIEITVTFSDLSPDAQADFSDYFRQDLLIITARAQYNKDSGGAQVKQYGSRLGMEEFAPYFKLLGDGAKVADLQAAFNSIKERFPDIPSGKTTKDSMSNTLQTYEKDHPEKCKAIPSEDQFYGISHGQGLLRKYVQWVYVPAVKDAAGEQSEARNTALGRLLARTVRAQVNFSERLSGIRSDAEEKYKSMLVQEQDVIDNISQIIQQRLSEWSHPEATARLLWHQDPKSSVRIEEPMARLLAGDGEFEGSIARFGHGMQRSYIIALLQGLSVADAQGPRLLLGVEEPELYQHPPQARHLATVLQELSNKNAQVMVSTHSPYFVDGSGFDRVRLVRKLRETGCTAVRSCSIDTLGTRFSEATGDPPAVHDGILVKLHQVMQPHLSEMFFTPRLVLVEGLEDAAYINAWMILSNRWEKFRARGTHVVAVNGKSELIRPVIIAAEMGIPLFLVFDCDGDKISHSDPAKQKSLEAGHRRDNIALLRLSGADENPFPPDTIWMERLAAWPHDLGKCIQDDAGVYWEPAGNKASALFGNVSGLRKNSLHIAARLKELNTLGANMATIDRLCESIIEFAEQS